MPLPRISVSSRLPTVAKSEKNLRTLQPKTICSTSSPTQFPPPSHEHIAHLIRDQKSASEALQSFRWASKLPNFTHNQCTYRSLIYKLCVFRRFEDVHHLLDEMPSSIGAPPDEDIFVTIVRGLGRAQRIREVIKVPALVQRFGLAPSLKIYNTILDVLVKEDIDIARRFFREKMMECGVHGDDYTFGILMKGLSLTNRIGHGFKLLQVMKTRGLTPNTTIYNTLLHALCKNGKVGRARSLMTEMTEPNDVTYNLMISAYCKEDNLVQAQVLLEKSFASGFVPDNVTVTKVMNLLCSVGRAHEAAEVLERTENNGGRVDVVAYNILIRGFCSIEKAKVGVHFKKQMENKGILPNVDTYNALIAGFCNLDLLDSALDLFSEMKADAIDCNLVTYDTLIKGFCSKGRVEEGFRVLEEMEESKVGGRGHISPYNSIIYGLYLQSRYDEALDFLNKMGKMFPRAVDRTLRILGLCNEGKIAGAKEVYDQMIHEGGVPSVLVYSSLIEGFCEHKQVREAFELMNEMVSRGYIPGTSIYNAIITGFCRQGKIMSALNLVEDIRAKGFLLNVGTFSPLINALCSKGDLRRAMKIFEQMADQEDESSLDNDYPEFPCNSPKWNRDEDEPDSGLHGFVTKDFDQVGHQISSKAVESDGNLRRRKIAYNDIMKNYDELGVRTESLDQAKRKVLRYTPGSWINDVGGKKLSNYVIPKTTTLLLVGPKGSGKSSLVNRISRVFEDDKFASERAQVTYNSSSEEGTFFLEEYMIPRGATSFCLFDTRSLSDNFADNEEMLQYWMTKGVRHGELVVRDADSSSLKMALKCKAQQSGSPSSEIRKVNFVIFVVNGFSALRSMNSDKEEDKRYMEMVVKTFNYPYLSFKDDKPVVAVTHGDFLSLKDRARVRIYLGEKLGVPPAKQIFDIPESSDQATELAIVDMIRYSLEHADKNLPYRGPWEWVDRTILSLDSLMYKLFGTSLMFWTLMFLAILLGIACAVFPMQQSWNYNRLSSAFPVGWPSKSEVEHPYEHQGSFMPSPSRLWSKSAVNNSQEQRRCEKQEPETTSPPALASKDAVAKSARLLRRKSNVDRHRNHRRSHSTSSKSLHPKSKVKWHKIRHLWLDDDSESQHPQSEVEWHKIRHVWSDDDSENRNAKSAVKWHKIRHLRADDD